MKIPLRISFFILSFICSITSFAQNLIRGIVYDSDSLKLQHVSVVLTDTENDRIIDFTFTGDNGRYELLINRRGTFKLTFSHIGYATINVPIEITAHSKEKDIVVVLDEKTVNLDEIIIQEERPVIVKKDTINFKTKYFVNGTEQTVEDLLRKIPGLQIDSDGTIRVGNQEIEKIMVEGDDFFEKGYRILSKNMPAYPIEEVEVLKNYSNNRLLKDIYESEKVALNLKLNEKSKRIWFGNAATSLGNDSFYQLTGNLMNFGKKNKYYFLTNLNSIGNNATGDIEHLVRPFRIDEPANIGDNQSVQALLSLSPNQLNFKQSRTNFNNAELVSLNAIFNPTEKLKIKTLGFFNWDEADFFRNSTDFIDVKGANFTNTENYQLQNNQRIAFGKLDISHNSSTTKTIEATTKYNNGAFSDGSDLVFNGNSTIEDLQYQNTLFDQKISFTNKLKDNKVLLLAARYINEKTPQNYSINQFFYEDLFPASANANDVAQQITNRMQFAGVGLHLIDRKKNGDLFELQLGNEFRSDKLWTTFNLSQDDLILSQPEGFQNQTTYQVNELYFKSKYRLKIKDFGIAGRIDVYQLFNYLNNNNVSSTQNPFFINPNLSFDWKINKKNKITSSYSYNTTNAKILDVFSDFALTGFRSFSRGTSTFNQLSESMAIINYQLGNWTDRFFVNTFILYRKSHDFFSTNTVIEQNYTTSEKILIQNPTLISINSQLDRYFKFIAANLKLDLSYSQNEFSNIINNSDLRRIISKNYTYGLEIRSAFKGIFNYHAGTKWTATKIETTVNNSFTDNVGFLDLSFVFNQKFDVQIQAERYYFGNLKIDNTYYFLDFESHYKLIENKLTIGLSGKNLFNAERFRNFSVSDIGTSITEYRLLPRFFLLKLEYRF